MIKYIPFLALGLISLSCDIDKDSKRQIKIQWTENLDGDFTFRKQWSYPEGVYKNDYGQLSCDGICQDRIYGMIDDNGKIYTDSIELFYQLLDTTHQFHTIECEAWCYEWTGTDFIKAKQNNNENIKCYTLNNSGTHCSLVLEISEKYCIPTIELNSITSLGTKTYDCNGGYIKIDKEMWDQSVIKAEFSFDFQNTNEPDKQIYWKGKIYTDIEKN